MGPGMYERTESVDMLPNTSTPGEQKLELCSAETRHLVRSANARGRIGSFAQPPSHFRFFFFSFRPLSRPGEASFHECVEFHLGSSLHSWATGPAAQVAVGLILKDEAVELFFRMAVLRA